MAVKEDVEWPAIKGMVETFSEAAEGALFSPSVESATTYEKITTPLSAHEERLPTPPPTNEDEATRPESELMAIIKVSVLTTQSRGACT